jgi:hypothetical protein
MIILEGTDHTGKTTMARRLCEILAVRYGNVAASYYAHMTRPPANFDHLSEYMNGVRFGVQDRYHLGSVVYGRLLNGGSFCSPHRMLLAQRFLRWCGCYVVILTCDRDVLRKRLLSSVDKEEMYSVEKILDAGDAFRALSKSHNRGEPWCDESIDVTSSWPDDKTLVRIVDDWERKFLL